MAGEPLASTRGEVSALPTATREGKLLPRQQWERISGAWLRTV
jgi:hypothetical protein